MKNLMLFVLSAFVVLAVACASKTDQADAGKKSSTDDDNTARSIRHSEGATLTAGDRSSGKRN